MRTYLYCDVTRATDQINIRWTDRVSGEGMLAELQQVHPFKFLDEKEMHYRDYGAQIGKFGGFMGGKSIDLAFAWIVRYLCQKGWEPMQIVNEEISSAVPRWKGYVTSSRTMAFRYLNNDL